MSREFITSSKLQADFCWLIQGVSFPFEGQTKYLTELISGKVYQSGYRPRDSRDEDIVVTHTAGIARKDLVRGEITINIFSQDISMNGVLVANPQRVPLLEQALQAWVKALNLNETHYLISLLEPIKTVEDTTSKEHFIVAHLQYEYCLTN